MAKNSIKSSMSSKLFNIVNLFFLSTMSIICIIPIIQVLAVSFSDPIAAQSGIVHLWPVGFNMHAYQYVITNQRFWTAMFVSLERILIGGTLSVFITILTAYPLSRSDVIFPKRKYYVWILFFTMLFQGGMIPSYLVVKYTGLLDTIWALVLPVAVNVYNIILMLNFFRQLPKELDEAAYIDGANHLVTLFKVYIPISLPSLATITLFTIVVHWNSWFDGMIYMSRPEYQPLQTYLRSIIVAGDMVGGPDMAELYKLISAETLKAAQIFVGALPVLLAYPFLQKYFTKGIVLGSVKG